MDYSKVGKAKTYHEAVELLRPLIERVESVSSPFLIEVRKHADENVSVKFAYGEHDLKFGYKYVISLSLYGDDRNIFTFLRGDNHVLHFCRSYEIDANIDKALSEVKNDLR